MPQIHCPLADVSTGCLPDRVCQPSSNAESMRGVYFENPSCPPSPVVLVRRTRYSIGADRTFSPSPSASSPPQPYPINLVFPCLSLTHSQQYLLCKNQKTDGAAPHPSVRSESALRKVRVHRRRQPSSPTNTAVQRQDSPGGL